MFDSKMRRARSVVLVFLLVAAMPLMTGCIGVTLRATPGISSGPTVGDLVDHVACEVGKAYVTHAHDAPPKSLDSAQAKAWTARQALWQHLYSESFVGAVDLTLQVTDTDSAGYSYSWISPLTGNGKPAAKPYVYSGMGATSATNNKTLALGLSLNGTQDRNVEQDFNLDVRRIVDAYNGADLTGNNAHNSHFPFCAPRESGPSVVERMESSLQGNLSLPETIEDGLIALERSGSYNVYGASGPTRFVDVIGPPLVALEHGPAGGPGLGTGGSGGGTSSSKNSFASKVDFSVTTGIGGGPTYSLLLSKLSASGGGSSGGGQPLNFSRMTQDSFTVTFGATCKQPEGTEAATPATFSIMTGPLGPPGSPTGVLGLGVKGSTSEQHGGQDYDFAFVLSTTGWFTGSAAPFTIVPGPITSTGQVQIFDHQEGPNTPDHLLGQGDVAWAGFVRGDGTYDIRGVVKSALTGNVVGQIWLEGKSSDLARTGLGSLFIRHMPYFMKAHLLDDTVDQDYWSTIPGCDTLTAAQVQSVTDDLSNKTLLQSYLRP